MKIIPITFFFFFVTLPTLRLPRDMWDGTIIEYASLIKNFYGLKSYFLESTWYIQYPLSLATIKASQFIGISYKNMNAILVLAFMSFFLNEIYLLAKNRIKLSKVTSCFLMTLVATFYAWGNLLSSIMTLHLGCMALGLFSLRKIHSKNFLKIIVGFTVLIISLSLQSQLFFLPILSYIYDTQNNIKIRKSWLIYPSLKTILILLICIICYLIIKQIFPPYEIYKNYNNIIIFSPDGLTLLMFSMLRQSTYLLPIIIIIICLGFINFLFRNKGIKVNRPKYSYNPKWLIWSLIIFFAGSFPYNAVGKSSTLLDITDWNGRQAFLIILPTCLFTTLCLQYFFDNSSTRFLKTLVKVSGVVIVFFNIIMLTIAITYKTNRQVFVNHLEKLIAKNQSNISPGLLEIIGSNIPGPPLRVYESNFLMYNATGKANWWTQVSDGNNEKFVIPCFIQENYKYQIKYIYNFNHEHLNNHTIIEIVVKKYNGPLNMIRNFFGVGLGEIKLSYVISQYKKKVEKCK